MRLATWLGLAVTALSVASAACVYPDFQFEPEDGTGGTALAGGSSTGAGGLGGTAGTGGTGGTPTATGAGGTGGGGTGGTGGTPPTPCELWGADVCSGSEKCSVVDESTGETACVEAGPRPAWAHCESDNECRDRTWCDHDTQVCKPLCQNGNDCPVGGNCRNALASGGGNIPGLQVCTSHCDPMVAQSCNQSFGTTNCILAPYGFDCFASGQKGMWEGCSDSRECGPTLGCYTVLFITWCRPWCEVDNDNCPILTSCLSHTPPVYYNSVEYGSCG